MDNGGRCHVMMVNRYSAPVRTVCQGLVHRWRGASKRGEPKRFHTRYRTPMWQDTRPGAKCRMRDALLWTPSRLFPDKRRWSEGGRFSSGAMNQHTGTGTTASGGHRIRVRRRLTVLPRQPKGVARRVASSMALSEGISKDAVKRIGEAGIDRVRNVAMEQSGVPWPTRLAMLCSRASVKAVPKGGLGIAGGVLASGCSHAAMRDKRGREHQT